MRGRVVFGIAVGVGALALSLPASAKECVEPYGELVAVSDVETIVRIKPECAALAALADDKAVGKVSFASALVVEPEAPRSPARLRFPEPIELAARPVKRAVSCSDPAVCGAVTKVAEVKRPSRCEYGRGYAVGVSAGLTEVRIYDDCRHMMNPKASVAVNAVPAVLAPDWELDTSPAPKVPRRRVRPPSPPSSKQTPPDTTTAPKAQSGVRADAPKVMHFEKKFTVVAQLGADRLAVINRRIGVTSPVLAISFV